MEKERNSVVNISNLFDAGKIKVQGVEADIESSVVYPLLRWSDMAKCVQRRENHWRGEER